MELFVEIPRDVIKQARKYAKRMVKAQGAPLDFRMSLIACCLAMDPRQGHFELKNNCTNEILSLQMFHVGSCKKKAILKEAPTQAGIMIKFEGDCTCEPRPSISKVIEMKVKFVQRWQIRNYCTDMFLETLKTVGENIEKKIQPVMSNDERAILIDNLAEEGLQALTMEFENRMPKLKLVGGDDSGHQVVEQKTTTSEVIDEGSTSVEVRLEGPLFLWLGIKAFFLRFLNQRPITTRTTTVTTRQLVGDTSNPIN